MTVYARQFLDLAMTQAGKQYQWGVEDDNNPDPTAFDCSEFVQWLCERLSIPFVDGSGAQWGFIRAHGLLVPVNQAIATPAALLFRPWDGSEHVAISRGDGTTIEAKGHAYGTNVFSAIGRFDSAGLIPGLNYGSMPTETPTISVPEEDTVPDFVSDPHGFTAANGRKGGYKLLRPWRTVVALNGAPLCNLRHGADNRAVMPPIPAKYGEIEGMDYWRDSQGTAIGLIVLMGDDGTLTFPFNGPMPRL